MNLPIHLYAYLLTYLSYSLFFFSSIWFYLFVSMYSYLYVCPCLLCLSISLSACRYLLWCIIFFWHLFFHIYTDISTSERQDARKVFRIHWFNLNAQQSWRSFPWRHECICTNSKNKIISMSHQHNVREHLKKYIKTSP